MKIRSEPYLKPYSRDLRNNMTEAERRVWYYIRNKQLEGIQFYRQRPVGPYIVDFYCPRKRLIIEIDGSQHLTPEGLKKDAIRDAFLRKLHFRVLRFNNSEVMTNIEGVIERVMEYL